METSKEDRDQNIKFVRQKKRGHVSRERKRRKRGARRTLGKKWRKKVKNETPTPQNPNEKRRQRIGIRLPYEIAKSQSRRSNVSPYLSAPGGMKKVTRRYSGKQTANRFSQKG